MILESVSLHFSIKKTPWAESKHLDSTPASFLPSFLHSNVFKHLLCSGSCAWIWALDRDQDTHTGPPSPNLTFCSSTMGYGPSWFPPAPEPEASPSAKGGPNYKRNTESPLTLTWLRKTQLLTGVSCPKSFSSGPAHPRSRELRNQAPEREDQVQV